MSEDLSEQLLYAIYTPAIQRSYAQFALKKPEQTRKLPGELVPADLNFLSRGSRLFHIPAALYSAGQFSFSQMKNPKPCMVLNRNRDETLILGDSGGFQILTGKLEVNGDEDRTAIFDWLAANTDIAMTLDVPTAHAEDYKQFGKCLDATLEHLEYWRSRHVNGRSAVAFLNVLQGGYPNWITEWDDFVSDETYSGWAIAGKNKKSLYIVLKRLLKLVDDDKINDKQFWVHFLGVSDLRTACFLSAIKRNLEELLGNGGFYISFDASNPFLLAGEYCQAYTSYVIKKSGLRLPTVKFDSANPKHIGSDEPFPYADASPIGRLMTMGDLVVKRSDGNPGLDALAIHMLANHNLYVHVKGVIEANKLFASDHNKARHHFPVAMLQVREAIHDIIRAECPFDELEKNRKLLTRASARE